MQLSHINTRCLARVAAWVLALAGLAALACLSPATHAQELTDAQVVDLGTATKRLEESLANADPDKPGMFAGLVDEADAIRSAASACVESTRQLQTRLTEQLAALGQETAGDTNDVIAARRALQQAVAETAQRMGACRLLLLDAQRLITAVNAHEQRVLTSRLLTRGPALTALAYRNLAEPLVWIDFARNFVLRDSGLLALPTVILIGLPIIGVLGGFLGARLRRETQQWLAGRAASDRMTDGLIKAAGATLAHYAPHLIATSVISGYLTIVSFGQWPLPFINVLAIGLALYYALTSAVRMLLAPSLPAAPFLPLPAIQAHQLARRLQVLALLLLLGFLLFATLLSWQMPEPQYLLVRGIYVTVLVVNLIWVVWLTGRLAFKGRGPEARFLLSLVLFVALVAEWLGYRNLTTYLMVGLVGTLLALGLTWLVARLLGELFDSLDEGRYRWAQRLRGLLGFGPGEYVPGLNGLRFLVNLILLAGLILWLLRIWGLSAAGFATITRYVTDGFSVAGFHIVPIRLLWALLMFVLLLTLFRWFKRQLVERWTAKMRIDRGAREAIITTSGYLGGAVAFLVMLSIAGIEFRNLAIIAGALSVGIGFGLQNVVNNFVSGLILLLERPIRTGDWIVVGSTEGYVKRISIRSTQIQTFDRADVIVPNSELIAGQVTNWTLGDPYGRVVVTVGVAYGSDPIKVRDILLDVGQAHPQVLRGVADVPDPNVIFRRFGDSSLDFELRCMIRDVNQRLAVLSDLNFAIEKAFREHAIEVPFPQRDVRVVNWPAPGTS